MSRSSLRAWSLTLTIVASALIAWAARPHTETFALDKPTDKASAAPTSGQPGPSARHVLFETDVLPILKANCMQCHGPETRTKDMDLSTLTGVMKGSETGAVIIPGKPDESLLYKKVSQGLMPKGGKPLSKDLVATIRTWIEEGSPSAVSFEASVLPIFTAKCVACHGPRNKVKDLDLSTAAGVMKGGESGAEVVAGHPEESRLYKLVHEGSMPTGGKPLSQDEVATVRAWIEAGAPSESRGLVAADVALTENDVMPILLLRCTACHGASRRDGGLDLHTREAMLKGGKSGPAMVLGKPDRSLLIQKIRSGEMPPKRQMLSVSVNPITQGEADKLAKWIARGAPEANLVADVEGGGPDPLVSEKDRQFWAFQPPRRPAVPSVQHADRVRNPIDAFVLSKLEAKGLTLSPEADRLKLVRRVYFDLTGLPPAPDEVKAFLADRDPSAYEKLVDRLLASPRYGDRWARYWLDVAGYADSEGGKLSADHPRPEAFRYRDYVIRSFNADKPYDRFLLEQIAGDELEDYEHAPVVTEQMMDNLIATGFLRMGPDSTSEREVDFVEDRLDVIADELDVLGSGVMGLTIKCARCHSHKYDPIPQRDYYQLVAAFKGAYDFYNWMMPNHLGDGGKVFPARFLPYVTPGATPAQVMAEQQQREAHNDSLEQQIKSLKETLDQKAEPVKKKILDQRLAQLPTALQDDLRKTLATPPEERTQVQKYLAEKFANLLKVGREDLIQADAEYKRAAEETEKQIKLLEWQKIPEPKIRALWDQGDPSPTYLLRRGDPANFGPPVGPGVPAVLTDGKTPFAVRTPWPGAHKTGRRLAVARWLVRPDHPLTTRVWVNRTWAHHFGRGIVQTLGNFGHTGAPPTNPELLDWLATEFVSQGWSIKTMHRLMVTSSTYRQSSVVTPALEKLDPDNRLLSRMPMQRLDAEALYDTMLMLAGRMDETRYGPPEPVEVRDDGLVTPIWSVKGGRRSIYVLQRRTEIPTLLANFDLPPMSPNCLERTNSTVALQALDLMNSGMVYQLAQGLAERVKKEVGADAEKEIERAYWIAVSRPPSAEEKKVSLEALNRLRVAETSDTRIEPVAAQKPAPLQAGLTPAVSAHGGAKDAQQEAAVRGLTKFCQTLLNSATFLYID